jgi:mRNA-degrading endonuclease RelE of RelBE toxin-antitoxin system
MNWVVRIADDAQRVLDELRPKLRRQVTQSISQMEQNPFHGDVKALQGMKWQGCYRKRSGDYRIVYAVDRKRRFVDVFWILARSEKTYR